MNCTQLLTLYSGVSTLAVILLSIFLIKCGGNDGVQNIQGNAEKIVKSDYGLLVVDNGSQQDSSCECPAGLTGWTVLELLVVGAMGVAGVFCLAKGAKWISSYNDKRKLRLSAARHV